MATSVSTWTHGSSTVPGFATFIPLLIPVSLVFFDPTCLAGSSRPASKITKTEDDQNGRRPKGKRNIMEDYQNGRQPKLEDDQN